jgi:iron complex outermembrane receptor protein
VPLPDLSVQLYNPSFNKDRFESTALMLNGRIGDLKLVYAGGYLVRNVEQVQDHTNYARGAYADYYQCVPGANGKPGQCYSPSTTWQENEKDTHNVTFINAGQFVTADTVGRQRTMGLKYSYEF